MIHQPMGGFQGQASDIAIQAKEILRMKDALNDILVRHTGKSVDDVQKDTDRDNFMSGMEAKNTASWTMSLPTGMTWII
jgi:ATP-dependent Clp protease protease subunit